MHFLFAHTACHGRSKSWEAPSRNRPPFRDLSCLRLTDGDARWTLLADKLHFFYTNSVNTYCVHTATQRVAFCALLIQNRVRSSTAIVQSATQSWLQLTICALTIQNKGKPPSGRRLDSFDRVDQFMQAFDEEPRVSHGIIHTKRQPKRIPHKGKSWPNSSTSCSLTTLLIVKQPHCIT